ncbi:MAG: hypothetical protein PVF47_03095 [Anaerolineae bacterium]
MNHTYTYTARNVESPAQVVTLTLHNHHMSVGLGAPLEQVDRLMETEGEDEAETAATEPQIWLKPLAISLVERGVGPFRIEDVYPQVEEDWLKVKAWYRAGGLGLVPVTLVDGQVDNAEAAQAFVQEVNRRKEEASTAPGPLGLLDYWITWFLVISLFFGFLKVWRNRSQS